jgi:uncharacterized protein YndB with AHSA1/START domain
MAVVSEKIDIVADQVTVFNVYVNQINEWWPRRGETNRYSFAPDTTEPDQILLDAKEGGRYYEVFADGTEHTIGTITTWDPPNEVAYTWDVAGWQGTSTVTVRFVASGDTTTVMVEHDGVPEGKEGEGYSAGHKEILGIFAAFVEAL